MLLRPSLWQTAERYEWNDFRKDRCARAVVYSCDWFGIMERRVLVSFKIIYQSSVSSGVSAYGGFIDMILFMKVEIYMMIGFQLLVNSRVNLATLLIE